MTKRRVEPIRVFEDTEIEGIIKTNGKFDSLPDVIDYIDYQIGLIVDRVNFLNVIISNGSANGAVKNLTTMRNDALDEMYKAQDRLRVMRTYKYNATIAMREVQYSRTQEG